MSDQIDKLKKQLRIVTARLFTLRLRDEDFREAFAAATGWTAQSPIVPCEHDTLFGEVHTLAVPALAESSSGVVAIPVLFFGDGKDISLSVLTMSADGHGGGEGSISIGLISHNVAMAQVCETLSPDKKWDVRDLDTKTTTRLSDLS
ncbi:hypothetical protein QNM97_13630 [Gordonia sp. L191]|uniref:hypothetical protein n=1 Tax=Gordonia sp. L191 TaxID=2982699 RepID=UPI0024C0DC64|nr:hypothetical protein [Gordonia sp. L191]WHU45091.1 hypothetical protein QNM97_13630 [Gordonia sp. L191]